MRFKDKLSISIICILISCINQAMAFSLEDILDAHTIDLLKQKGRLEKSYYNQDNVKLSLTPNTPLAKKAIQFWPASKDAPVYIAEELFLLDKKNLGSGDPSRVSIDNASKIIRSISKMEGMQYYSHKDKKIKTLYDQCYCIKGPKDRTKVPDDIYGNAEGKIMYCMQDDNSFGKTNYRLEYHQTEEETSAGFVCTTPIYMGIIKAIDTDNLRISLVITDCGDNLVVYMIVKARFPALSMFEDTMNESFGSRLDAIYKWFIKQF